MKVATDHRTFSGYPAYRRNSSGGKGRNNLRGAKSMLRRAAVVLAGGFLAVTVVASPTLAGNKTYSVTIGGDVAAGSFETPGNNSGTRLNPHPKQGPLLVVLDLKGLRMKGLSRLPHENSGVCSPSSWQLDGAEWTFHHLSFSKSGSLQVRFDLGFSDDCGFDDYVLEIRFDTEGSGPVYTTEAARIVIHHYAERDDPDNPGNKRVAHGDHCCDTPFFVTPNNDGFVTITITEL